MAALLKNKDASERERLIISIADDATSPRPFDAAGWQADTPVAIVRGDGFIPLSDSGQKAKYSLRADVFRCSANNGHRSIGSACPFGASSDVRCVDYNT
jgi:hypothetical protein